MLPGNSENWWWLLEMFLVQACPGAPEDASESLAMHVARCGGLVLMATATGALIVGMPPHGKEAIERHPYSGFVGGVTLDGQAEGARALAQRFARNAARQLLDQQEQPDVAASVPGNFAPSSRFGPINR